MNKTRNLNRLLISLNPKIDLKGILYKDTKLKDEFIQYLLKMSVPENKLPRYVDGANYRLDWNIIESGNNNFELLLNHYDGLRQFTPEYSNVVKMYEPVSTETKYEITNWLIYLSVKVFRPELIMIRDKTHNGIAMRIGISKLDKIDLSKQIKFEMFNNMMETFKIRYFAYKSYYNMEILGLPF